MHASHEASEETRHDQGIEYILCNAPTVLLRANFNKSEWVPWIPTSTELLTSDEAAASFGGFRRFAEAMHAPVDLTRQRRPTGNVRVHPLTPAHAVVAMRLGSLEVDQTILQVTSLSCYFSLCSDGQDRKISLKIIK